MLVGCQNSVPPANHGDSHGRSEFWHPTRNRDAKARRKTAVASECRRRHLVRATVHCETAGVVGRTARRTDTGSSPRPAEVPVRLSSNLLTTGSSPRHGVIWPPETLIVAGFRLASVPSAIAVAQCLLSDAAPSHAHMGDRTPVLMRD